ncbi:MAG: hypothetical protein ACE5OZ_18615 [Candidatus Heimdallarchaeota archaeon]
MDSVVQTIIWLDNKIKIAKLALAIGESYADPSVLNNFLFDSDGLNPHRFLPITN